MSDTTPHPRIDAARRRIMTAEASLIATARAAARRRVGRMIRAARLARGLRQTELAALAGVPATTVRQVEREAYRACAAAAPLLVALGLVERAAEAIGQVARQHQPAGWRDVEVTADVRAEVMAAERRRQRREGVQHG